MISVARWAVIGFALVAWTTVAAASATADDDEPCRESFMGGRVNENGILCPGDPTTWKSFTLPTEGFGYYVEIYDLGEGRSEMEVSYHHRNGTVAVEVLECEHDDCRRQAWNGVPFP